MKKILLILILLTNCLFVVCCSNKQEYIHLYDLMDKHLYSEDIKINVPYENESGEYVYFESSYPRVLQGYIKLLYIDVYTRKVSGNAGTYLKKNTNEKSFILKTKVDSEELTAYINENGKVIIKINDEVYESQEEIVNYNDFVSLVSSKEIDEFRFDDTFSRDKVQIVNSLYYDLDSIVRKQILSNEKQKAYYKKFLDNLNENVLLLKLPSKVYGNKHCRLSIDSFSSSSEDNASSRIYLGKYAVFTNYGSQWILIPGGSFDIDNYLLIGKLMSDDALQIILTVTDEEINSQFPN